MHAISEILFMLTQKGPMALSAHRLQIAPSVLLFLTLLVRAESRCLQIIQRTSSWESSACADDPFAR